MNYIFCSIKLKFNTSKKKKNGYIFQGRIDSDSDKGSDSNLTFKFL